MPLPARYHRLVCLAILFHVRTNVFHALFPAAFTVEGLVAAREQACGVLWVRSEDEITALLVSKQCAIGEFFLACVIDVGALGEWIIAVHATQMLCEEVFAIEVVVGGVCWIAVTTHIATPKAKLDMLSADVSLPLILRCESSAASV